MDYLPQAFQEFANGIQRDLSEAASRAIGLLRWRSAELGPQRPFEGGGGVSWTLGNDDWHDFPAEGLGGAIHPVALLEVARTANEDLKELASKGQEEPFTYELLREAWGLRETNPRSSLLLAITTLEVAVKQYIADRVEAATWLVDNLQSPDVIKLLREYLPTLAPPSGVPGASELGDVPDPVWRLLRNRRDQRNAIVHKPGAHVTADQIATPARAASGVLAVQRVLLRFDVANGRLWAGKYVCEPERDPPYQLPSAGYRRVG
jgi:hypothetical protein